MLERRTGQDWVGIGADVLPIAEAMAFAVVPSCGGVVTFCGTVRDFSEGRDGVSALEYEAFEEQVIERLDELARSARRAWPETGRIVMLHRTGHLDVTDTAVVVCASTPHRAEAFEVARYLIGRRSRSGSLRPGRAVRSGARVAPNSPTSPRCRVAAPRASNTRCTPTSTVSRRPARTKERARRAHRDGAP
jgi:molybdopterin synthase catalytic subunit